MSMRSLDEQDPPPSAACIQIKTINSYLYTHIIMKTTVKNTQGDEDIQKSDAFRWRSGLVGALTLGSVAFVAGTLVKVFLNTDEYDGLHSLVSYSSRMIAGGFCFCSMAYTNVSSEEQDDSLTTKR